MGYGAYPGTLEQLVLLGVCRSGALNAYAAGIHKMLSVAGHAIKATSVNTTLVRMEQKEWVTSSLVHCGRERKQGVSWKRIYCITTKGRRVLKQAEKTRQLMKGTLKL